MAGLFSFGPGSNSFDPTGASLGLMQLAQAFNRRPRISTNPADVTGPDDSGMQQTLGLMNYQRQAARDKLLAEQAQRQARLDELKIGQAQRDEENRKRLMDLASRPDFDINSPEGRAAVMGADIKSGIGMYTKDNSPLTVKPGETLLDRNTLQPKFKAPPNAETDITKNLRAIGVDPASPEGQKFVRDYLAKVGTPPSVTANMNMDMKQPGAAAETIGKGEGEMYVNLQKADMNAPVMKGKLAKLGAALKDAPQGATGPTEQRLREYAQSLGLNANAGPGQLANSIAREMALELRNPAGGAGMPGAMSDQDRNFLASMTPNLANTPEGNAAIIEWRTRLLDRDQQVAKLARDYKKRNGGRFDDGFYDELANWSAKNPLFTEKDAQKLQSVSASAPSPMQQTSGNQPVTVKNEADYASLPAGAEYIDPNGVRRRKGGPASARVPIR